jgi:hypothetical protein
MNYKEKFIKIYNEQIKRSGANDLLNWLEKTDFFVTPASTKFHCACENGLVMHSISVYEVLVEKHFNEKTDNSESFAICGLLHDVCKVQFYKLSTRNFKNESTGFWEKKPYFSIEDSFPYGHGEKSVFLIERFMRLKTIEAVAIRWHMGGFDDTAKLAGFTLSAAFEKFPLAVQLHLADVESSFLREKGTSAAIH